MKSEQFILDHISVSHDWASQIILLGVVQGIFLTLLIFLRARNKNTTLKLFAWSLLFQSLIALDIYLCYTGLMKHTVVFNDSTEPLVLLIAPTLYLFVHGLLTRIPFSLKKHWVHFVPALLYTISQIGYYLQPISIKINAYLGAYNHTNLRCEVPADASYNYHWIKDEFRWLVLISFVVYIILSARVVLNYFKEASKKGPKHVRSGKFNFTKNTVLILLVSVILILSIFLSFDDDAGDHYIGMFNTGIVFLTSFVILTQSRFFENSWVADKYETVKAGTKAITISQIKAYVEKENFFLSSSATLKELAKALHANPNYISQVINDKTELNFNDFINRYRVEAAKEKLVDPTFSNLTIEAIGNLVGFNSKSAFYTAFKKHTKLSPKAYITAQKSTEL